MPNPAVASAPAASLAIGGRGHELTDSPVWPRPVGCSCRILTYVSSPRTSICIGHLQALSFEPLARAGLHFCHGYIGLFKNNTENYSSCAS